MEPRPLEHGPAAHHDRTANRDAGADARRAACDSCDLSCGWLRVVTATVITNPGDQAANSSPAPAATASGPQHQRTHRLPEVIMNRIRQLASILAALTVSLLAPGAAPAFAQNLPPTDNGDRPSIGPPHLTTHLIATGGMPGWQITLIAAGAALAAAALAVAADRAWAARRHPAPSA
jgi:hypothetical protein